MFRGPDIAAGDHIGSVEGPISSQKEEKSNQERRNIVYRTSGPICKWIITVFMCIVANGVVLRTYYVCMYAFMHVCIYTIYTYIHTLNILVVLLCFYNEIYIVRMQFVMYVCMQYLQATCPKPSSKTFQLPPICRRRRKSLKKFYFFCTEQLRENMW